MVVSANSWLTHSPADVIRWLLISLGLGVDPNSTPPLAWPVYATGEPSALDNIIRCHDTEGQLDGKTMPDAEVCQHFGVQVMVRSSSHPIGWAKINAIVTLLDKVSQADVTVPVIPAPANLPSKRYLVWSVSRKAIIPLGKGSPNDKQNRFTVNLLVPVRAY